MLTDGSLPITPASNAPVTITCPQCGYWRSTDPAVIPPGAVTVVCPGCRHRFSLSRTARPSGDNQVLPDQAAALQGGADSGRPAPGAPPLSTRRPLPPPAAGKLPGP